MDSQDRWPGSLCILEIFALLIVYDVVFQQKLSKIGL